MTQEKNTVSQKLNPRDQRETPPGAWLPLKLIKFMTVQLAAHLRLGLFYYFLPVSLKGPYTCDSPFARH